MSEHACAPPPVLHPPLQPNPAYKGKWSAPLIDNPAYKGVWKPRDIPNPEYVADPAPLTNIGKVRCSQHDAGRRLGCRPSRGGEQSGAGRLQLRPSKAAGMSLLGLARAFDVSTAGMPRPGPPACCCKPLRPRPAPSLAGLAPQSIGLSAPSRTSLCTLCTLCRSAPRPLRSGPWTTATSLTMWWSATARQRRLRFVRAAGRPRRRSR